MTLAFMALGMALVMIIATLKTLQTTTQQQIHRARPMYSSYRPGRN